MNDPKLDERAYLFEQIEGLANKLHLAIRISNATKGRYVKTRFGWASYLFARLCVIGISLEKLLDGVTRPDILFTLDHTSIASLSRNMIEASLMLTYLSESGLTDEQWKLRRDVLWLHDATTRYKMFKGWGEVAEAAGHRAAFEKIRKEVSASKIFQKIDKERQQKILAGSEMYVDGLRSVVRTAGIDKAEFEGIYAYLSQHSHSAPVSFIRTADHEIDYERPSDAQMGLSAFALEMAIMALDIGSKRMVELYPDAVPDHGITDIKVDEERPELPRPADARN